MSISESLKFSFNGISSDMFGIINVNVSSGLYQESFLSNRNLLEVTIRNSDKPYFQKIKREPLTFKLSFAFEKWDSQTIKDVAKWLNTDFYAPLIFESEPDLIYYAILINDSILNHTGNYQGFITLEMRCNTYHAFGKVQTSQIYDLSANPIGGTPISFYNGGELPTFPSIYVNIVSGSTFSIVNTSNKNQTLSFTGLAVNENLTIDCDNHIITTDIANTYRYGNMSGDYIEEILGQNTLQVYGNVKIYFQHEYRFLTE